MYPYGGNAKNLARAKKKGAAANRKEKGETAFLTGKNGGGGTKRKKVGAIF